jgi:hypothetical protein
MLRVIIISLISLTASGCMYPMEKTERLHSKELTNERIQIHDDLYYVSIGRDKDGCMMYSASSDGNATMTAVVYRNRSGKFTLNKNTNLCR